MKRTNPLRVMNRLCWLKLRWKLNRKGCMEVMMISCVTLGEVATLFPLLWSERQGQVTSPSTTGATWKQYPLLCLSSWSLHERGYWTHSNVMNNAAFAGSTRLKHAPQKKKKKPNWMRHFLPILFNGILPKLVLCGKLVTADKRTYQSPSDKNNVWCWHSHSQCCFMSVP